MSTVFPDLTVLDLSQDVAGPYCARLLGDFGADVIKVESMTGDSGRALEPTKVVANGERASAFFAYLNLNKRDPGDRGRTV